MQANPPSSAAPGDAHPLEQQRRANRDLAASLGVSPYGRRTPDLVPLADARARYDEAADKDHQATGKEPGFQDRRPRVRVAGRIMLLRDGGSLIWLQLRDHTCRPGDPERGDLQVAVSKRDCDEKGFALAKAVDLGDIVIAEGPLMRTRTGEVTVWASSLDMASKSLAPPPEKHAGLQNPELRYRRRYVDLYANPETMWVFQARSRLIAAMRRFLDGRGFVEVDTPVLQRLAGGAAARPFLTHMNALDIDLFMRIAPELYLKRLLVGGMPRVYEVSRNFRNEGVDRSHNPEFTSLEVYEAFGSYETMRELTESLIREMARIAASMEGLHAPDSGADPERLILPFGDLRIDYGSPFAQITYAALFEKALGFPMTDIAKVRAEAKRRGFPTDGLADALVVNTLFEEVAEHAIDPQRPTFVLDYPAALSPLTRPRTDDPSLAERWDIFIGGMEVGPAYTELNDPDIQEAKFREQLQGLDDEETTFRTFDADFIEALKVGMPPAGGMGMGVDRVVMLLTNQRSIRDVILFPLMRPGEGE